MTIHTYKSKRRLKVAAETWIEPKTIVPQISIWPRHETFLRTGHVEEVEVSEDEFEAALAAIIPTPTDLELTRIREHHGLGEGVGLTGPTKRPFTRTQVLKEAEAERTAAEPEPARLPGPVPTAVAPKKAPATGDKVKLVREPRVHPAKAKKAAAKKAAPQGA